MTSLATHQIFDDLTSIIPAPGSSKLFRADKENSIQDAVQEYWGQDAEGKRVLLSSKPYKKERFEGTIQKFKPIYDDSLRRWLIIDPTDITKTKQLTTNSDLLNDLVANCYLNNDNPNHPDFGKKIVSANIMDKFDPFFRHQDFTLQLEGGYATIPSKMSDSFNVIKLLCILARREFVLGADNNKFARGSMVRYLVVDKKIEKELKKATRNREEEAREYFKKLDDKAKVKITIALGLPIKLNTPIDLVDEILYEYHKDNVTKADDNTFTTKQENFVQMIKKPLPEIDCYYAFNLGMKYGQVKFFNKAYLAFGVRLGSTKSEAITYLLNENNDLMVRIIEASLEMSKRDVTTMNAQKKETPSIFSEESNVDNLVKEVEFKSEFIDKSNVVVEKPATEVVNKPVTPLSSKPEVTNNKPDNQEKQ